MLFNLKHTCYMGACMWGNDEFWGHFYLGCLTCHMFKRKVQSNIKTTQPTSSSAQECKSPDNIIYLQPLSL